eukprot:TRINITY_DN6010_c0_g1_i2.p1 TRINITY_DN6010_c0_g1~~TRINITY_DN6010_c0_g1_i2.p1  ORF type:complete len:190 (-),score=-17.06 TRINITY_DN6010_c0_g1_i2:291-860(-)
MLIVVQQQFFFFLSIVSHRFLKFTLQFKLKLQTHMSSKFSNFSNLSPGYTFEKTRQQKMDAISKYPYIKQCKFQEVVRNCFQTKHISNISHMSRPSKKQSQLRFKFQHTLIIHTTHVILVLINTRSTIQKKAQLIQQLIYNQFICVQQQQKQQQCQVIHIQHKKYKKKRNNAIVQIKRYSLDQFIQLFD